MKRLGVPGSAEPQLGSSAPKFMNNAGYPDLRVDTGVTDAFSLTILETCMRDTPKCSASFVFEIDRGSK